MAFQTLVEQWGPFNKRMWGTAAPTLATEGPFSVGDVIINTAPTAGGTYSWVCTTAGSGSTSVWKTVALSA